MRTYFPVRGKVYTLNQLVDLTLSDSPFLRFAIDGHRTVIQDGHVTVDEILAVPGLALTEWAYVHTTSESIPVFRAIDDEAVLKCVDVEPLMGAPETDFWVTPKGFPRAQWDMPFEYGHIYTEEEIFKLAVDMHPMLRDGDKYFEFEDSPDREETTYHYVALTYRDGRLIAVFEKFGKAKE